MKADFLDAHHRHWQDAETLFQRQRWANADHLYGIAAECGLKRLMAAFDTQNLWPGGEPSEGIDRVHIMEPKKPTNAWDRFEAYRSGHALGTAYPLPTANPFLNWDISDRYVAESKFSEIHVDAHRKGASLVHNLVAQADKDGLLT